MRAVVDTNILIRALIKPAGTVGPVIRRLVAGDYTIIYSRQLVTELLEKLSLPRLKDKYGLTDDDVATILDLLMLRGELVDPDIRVNICRDPDDNRVIEAALAGRADYIVTGDDDLLSLKKHETIDIITPRAFLARLDSP